MRENLFLKNLDSVFVFCASFFVYLITLCPTVYVGDSGELAAAALTMGIAHPPGYPAYIILAKLFSVMLPFADTAFEINLFSAFCASLTVMTLNIVLKFLGINKFIAVSGALAFGFLNIFWSQATIARVYTLNAFLMSVAVYYLIRYDSTLKTKNLYLYFLFAGLGLANHLVSVITLPAVLLIIFSRKNLDLKKPKFFLSCLSSLSAGLFLYAYLPFRSHFNPVINWGNPGSETGKGLLEFIFRKEYWSRAYVENLYDAFEVVVFYLRLIPEEFHYAGTVFIILGLFVCFKKTWRRFSVLSIIFSLNIFFMIIHASRSDIFYWPRYVIPAFISLGIWLALGLNFVFVKVKIEKFAFLTLIFPMILLIGNFFKNDRSNNYLALDYNKIILDNLPENSTLMAQGDNVLFPITYLHYVENARRDIKLFEVGMNRLAPYSFNPEKEPVFFTHFNDLKIPKLKLIPRGLVYQAATLDMNVELIDADKYTLRNLTQEKTYFDYLCRCLAGDYYFMVAANLHRKSFDSALPYYMKASQIAYDNDVTQYNLGLVFGREGMYPSAIEQFRKVLKIDRKNKNAPVYIDNFTKRIRQILGYLPDQYCDEDIKFIRYMDQGEKSFMRGDLKNALIDLNKILEFKPQSVQALNNLGAVYVMLGDIDKSLSIYQSILKIDANNTTAGKNLAWLIKLKADISDINRLSGETDTEKKFNLLRAKSVKSFKAGHPHESVFYLKSALLLKPNSIESLRDLAGVYIKLKQYIEAINQCNAILAINPDDKDASKSRLRLKEIVESLRF